MKPWNYAGELRTWPAGSWNIKPMTKIKVEVVFSCSEFTRSSVTFLSAAKLAKSKTTIGDLFTRVRLDRANPKKYANRN